METMHEFHYRLRGRIGGYRHGAHAGATLGAGQEFIAHVGLYDRPDPRRIDVHASMRNVRGDWLVRAHRQHAAVTVHVVIDVSASMRFGSRCSKLDRAAQFIEALGRSAFRAGDPLGMIAFDAHQRPDLYMPPLLNRGMGSAMAALLARSESLTDDSGGVEEAMLPIAHREGLIFLVSDFHFALERLSAALDLLSRAQVVPMITWDPAEVEPPERNALIALRDAETGVRRTLWMRPKLRAQWRAAVANRRAALNGFFAARGLRPFYVIGAFDSDAMSRYFFELAQ